MKPRTGLVFVCLDALLRSLTCLGFAPEMEAAVGFKNINIFEDDTNYKTSIDLLLKTISENPVGGVILGAIADHRKHVALSLYATFSVTIRPYDKGKAAVYGEKNAGAQASDAKGSAPKGVSGRGPGYWYAGKSDNPRTFDDERYTLMLVSAGEATGSGSNSTIMFSPEAYSQSSRPFDKPDVVLLHELVHSLRHIQGLRNPVPTKEKVWDNEEEYLAVVVEDVYQSAQGINHLRRGHGSEKLLPPQDTSAGFLDYETEIDGNKIKPNLELMSIYERIWPTFWQLAIHVKTAPFNPFREMLSRVAHLHAKKKR